MYIAEISPQENLIDKYFNLGNMTLDLREIEENDFKTRKKRERLLHVKRNDVDETSELLVSCTVNSNFTLL